MDTFPAFQFLFLSKLVFMQPLQMEWLYVKIALAWAKAKLLFAYDPVYFFEPCSSEIVSL